MTVPPLAGLFGYAEASRAGMPVERSAACLWRLAYAYRRLHALAVAVLPRTPEWEVKCALGLRVWLDAEHAAAFERRVNELRHPSVDAGDAPDPALAAVFDELAHVRDTGELLAAGDRVVRGALLRALETYLATANPLADHPSVRLVEAALRDERAAGGVERRGGGSGAVRGRLAGDGRRAARRRRGAAGRRAAGRAARRPAALGGRAAGARPGRAPRRTLRRPLQPVGADRRVLRGRRAARGRAGVRARLQAAARDGRPGVDGADHRRGFRRPAVRAHAARSAASCGTRRATR